MADFDLLQDGRALGGGWKRANEQSAASANAMANPSARSPIGSCALGANASPASPPVNQSAEHTKKPAPPMTLSWNSSGSAVPLGGTVAIFMANSVNARPATPITSARGPAREQSLGRRWLLEAGPRESR